MLSRTPLPRRYERVARADLETSTVGARVRTARSRLRLRRGRVARNAGFSRRELASFERGRREMSVEEIRSLAGSLGIDVGELLPPDELNDNPAPSELRIEDVLEVPDDLDGLAVLPPAEPLPELGEDDRRAERRRVPLKRTALDEAFGSVRAELDDVVQTADRMRAACSEDDVHALVYDLQRALGALRENVDFEVALERLDDARAEHHDVVTNHTSASWRSRRTDG